MIFILSMYMKIYLADRHKLQMTDQYRQWNIFVTHFRDLKILTNAKFSWFKFWFTDRVLFSHFISI